MKFSSQTWVAWFGATVMAALTLTAFAFTYFESKADALTNKQTVEASLQVISSDVKDILKRMPREK